MRKSPGFFCLLLAPAMAMAQSYETLYNWRFEGTQPLGRLIFHQDAYWGTTFLGGPLSGNATNFAGLGTAFKLSRAGDLTILHQFGGQLGSNPEGGLTLGSDGNFYGLAKFGGTGSQTIYSGGNGSIYKLSAAGAGERIFFLSGTNGVGGNPVGELIERSPGSFLGFNTRLNGSSSLLFEVKPAPFSYVPRGEFFESTAGKAASGLIKASDNNFYGTTRNAIVRLNAGDTAASALKTITAFESGSNFQPGVVQGADGRLYGVTEGGGANSKGVLWAMNLDGTNYGVLHHFSDADGTLPRCRLVAASDGALYGTAREGGTANKGTLFKITTAGVFTKLHDFSGADGADPRSLIEANGGLAGIAAAGGSTNKGVVFEASFSGEVTIIKELGNPAGHIPSGAPFFASDGNAYGPLAWGGPVNNGAIYRRKPGGAIELVHALAAGEGIHAQHSLSEGLDGALYGVTVGSLGTLLGNVFRLNKDGSDFRVLHSFSAAGTIGGARGPLAARPDGQLVGMNWQGGSSDPAIYRLGPTTITRRSIASPRRSFRPSPDASFWMKPPTPGSWGETPAAAR